MPNKSYRRNLRIHNDQTYVITNIQHSTPPPQNQAAKCNDPFKPTARIEDYLALSTVCTEINEVLDILITEEDYSEVPSKFTTILEPILPHIDYFSVINIIEDYCSSINNTDIQTIDRETIINQCKEFQTRIRDMPYLAQTNSIITERIHGLLEFIIQLPQNDTYIYSLRDTCTQIQTFIDRIFKPNKKMVTIQRIILDIIENLDNGAPSNVILWRVKYVRELVQEVIQALQLSAGH